MKARASSSPKVPPPRFFEAHDFSLLPAAHFGHALGEKSVGEDSDFRARLEEIHDRGFHSR
jgi:hypothetical protein